MKQLSFILLVIGLMLGAMPVRADQPVSIYAGLNINVQVIYVYDEVQRSWIGVNWDRVLSITGVPVVWHGYNVADKFGDFSYPSNGSWIGAILLSGYGVPDEEVWAWRQNGNNNTFLIFAFRDMQMNADPQGHHYGAHHFIAYSVLRADWDWATGMRN